MSVKLPSGLLKEYNEKEEEEKEKKKRKKRGERRLTYDQNITNA